MPLKDVGNWVGYTVVEESEKFDVTALAMGVVVTSISNRFRHGYV